MLNQFICEDLGIQESLEIKELYNESKACAYREYPILLKKLLREHYIKVHKYVIDTNVQEQIFDISEVKGQEYRKLHSLKMNPTESVFYAAQFIYILKKIDPNYEFIYEERTAVKISDDVIKVRPRLDNKNAEPRLYFQNAKVVMTSNHEDITNLLEILLVKDTTVFVIGMDESSKDLIAYEIVRTDAFYEKCEAAIKRIRDYGMNTIFSGNVIE